ncbi:hypothetical protein [Actinomadura vinacea]|uniref:hypothetical protein n=1 Tax=Actinomadura vinacea TaxID=115336 RepID=UPI0031DCB0DC
MRALIVVPAMAAAITAGTVTAASAATGVPSGPPPSASDPGVWCVSTSGAKACFAEYGDRVWVKDTKKNGASAAATIKDDSSSSNWYRECFNRRGADGGWVRCNFNVPEYNKGVLWAVNKPFVGNSASTTIWTSII